MDEPLLAGRRVAFFGGSFDPPHLGHMAVARAARAALGLDQVLFAPVGAQPLKPQGSTAAFEDRVAMTRLAIAGEPGFSVSLVDAPRRSTAPNYTVETLIRLRAELPPGGVLYCLMGADSFLSLRRWHRAAEMPFVAGLVVASRPGQPLDDLLAALPDGLEVEAVPLAVRPSGSGVDCYRVGNGAGGAALLYVLPGLHIEISASQIRGQIQSSDPSLVPEQHLLSNAVLDFIRAHELYR